MIFCTGIFCGYLNKFLNNRKLRTFRSNFACNYPKRWYNKIDKKRTFKKRFFYEVIHNDDEQENY